MKRQHDPITCSDMRDSIHAFIDGELAVERAAAVELHLQACAACAARVRRYRKLRTLTHAALAQDDAPAALVDRIRRQSSVPAPTRKPRAWFTGHTWALPTIAVLAVTAWLANSLLPRNENFVYHINDSRAAAAALRNIEFHLDAEPRAHIVVVTHNEGVDFLLDGAVDARGEDYRKTVGSLAQRGVEFRVCNNTLIQRDIASERVIPQARLVQSGIAEVGRLQREEGYAYLKP